MRCAACAAENAEEAKKCAACGKRLRRAQRSRDSGNKTEYYKVAAAGASQNPPAVAAYRFAIYGLIPVAGLFLGAVALGLGLVGFVRAKADAEAKGITHAIAGMVLGGLEVATNLAGLTLIWLQLSSNS